MGRALTAVASTPASVLVHCAGGRDRTGWLSDLMSSLVGVSQGARDASYLATKTYSGLTIDIAWLNAARAELRGRYGTTDRYLTVGCGLSAATLAGLKKRLQP